MINIQAGSTNYYFDGVPPYAVSNKNFRVHELIMLFYPDGVLHFLI